MEPVFGTRPGQPVRWYSTDPAQSNQHCLYCGSLVGVGSTIASNKEHLIARNFVPRGSLNGTAFNFIFRACVECNQRKADAERHVSTVTLFTSPARGADQTVDAAARHKASRDFHPRIKGTLVQDASTEHEYKGTLGAATLGFKMVAPPQLDESKAAVLACNQIQALFSLITTSDPRKPKDTRLLPGDRWRPLGAFPFQDWGNRQLQAVTERAAGWPLLAGIVSANGFFKVVLRRRDEPDGEWFWALEWNKSVRVIGAIFAADRDPLIFNDLPDHDWKRISPNTRMRAEIRLRRIPTRYFLGEC